jgi:hypothetical protein
MCLVIRKNTITLQLQSNQFAFLVMVSTITTLANSLKIQESVILDIIAHYQHMSLESLMLLVEKTTVKGCKFIGIRGYNSAKSEGTEIADLTVNIGLFYGRSVDKSFRQLFDYNVENVQGLLKEKCMGWNLSKIGLSKFQDKTNPHAEIFNLLPAALVELQKSAMDKLNNADTTKDRENNYIKLNDVLWYNTNTKNLNLFGKVVKKTIISADTSGKVTQSAPLTVAKDVIRSTFATNGLITTTIPNVLGNIVISGEVLDIS